VTTVAIDLTKLHTLPIDELRALWAANMGRSTPPRQRRLLVRELAWRTQERAHGGLDAQTRKQLQAAVRLVASTPRTRTSEDGTDIHTPKRRRKNTLAPHVPAATRLVREWRGKRHEVLVIDDGKQFRYHDRTYGSLSEIAREITGARWSGPRFFGLTTRERAGDKQPNSRSGKGLRGGIGERS